jgi:serine/threonine-protein kinase
MVAAAGEGAGLSRRMAWPLFLGILAGIAASFAMALRTSPFDRMRPEYPRDVLAQKARDAMRQIGYTARPRDEAYGFQWNRELIEWVEANDKPAPRWTEVLLQRPSPLSFWYRQSSEPLTSLMFHSDLLTPGIVDAEDPPPIISGMIQAELDHQGRLVFFEAIPLQRQESPTHPAPVDWMPLFQLAGLDPARLQPAEPLWNWLAASDTRLAWTGVWPESNRPLRVEAAVLGARPVAFMLAGPWRKPWRMPEPSGGSSTAYAVLLLSTSVFILIGAGMLARQNVREGRGDRRGAVRLAGCMTSVLLALWLCRVHLVASLGALATFLLAVCTSVFYGVLLWMVYLALEPFVRRHWPQVLVSWTNVLSGRVRDGVVSRDVLIGVALGIWFSLLLRGVALASIGESPVAFPGSVDVLLGLRSTIGEVFEEAPYAIRNVLLYFFILFVLRVILRRQWAGAVAFTAFFTILNALGNDHAWIGALVGCLYFGTAAVVILRWGLLPFTVAAFVNALLFDVTATLDTSAWYFGNMMLLLTIVVALAVWAFYTSVAADIWKPAVFAAGKR